MIENPTACYFVDYQYFGLLLRLKYIIVKPDILHLLDVHITI